VLKNILIYQFLKQDYIVINVIKMSSYSHITTDVEDEPSSTEKIQKILDGLGRIQGVKQALLVSEEGFPIMSARTKPITDEVETLVSAMVAGIVSTFAGACIQLELGKNIDFIHVQTPRGLGLISKIGNAILVLITHSDVKLGLMHYLITSTRDKMLKVRDF
jgi:predicted regulator of Ras-like GTPase activity (Roadblock/LC7/MglB family)